MKKTFLLAFLIFTFLTYGQKPDSITCDCNELTMKGKNGKSAFKDKGAFTGKCLTKNSAGIVTNELNYFNGQLEGESKTFYPTGKIKEITNYSGSMKHGKYILYSEIGKIITEGTYKNNQKDGQWKIYDKTARNSTKTIEYEFGKEKNRS